MSPLANEINIIPSSFGRSPGTRIFFHAMCLLTHTAHAAAHPFVLCASLSSRPGGQDGGRRAAAGWRPRLSECSLLLYFVTIENHPLTERVYGCRRPTLELGKGRT